MNKKGILIILSGFSGVGKGTVVRRLLSDYDNYALSISATTRKPREGEEDGVSYFFKSKEEFEQMIKEDSFIEHARYVENYYGTPKAYVQEQLDAGKDVILEIEIQGALKVKEKYPDALMLFLVPPDAQTLKERLVGRGTETADVIHDRLERAAQEAQEMGILADFGSNMNLDDVTVQMVPGEATEYNGYSVWSIHKNATIDVINEYFRPYQPDLSYDSLPITELIESDYYTTDVYDENQDTLQDIADGATPGESKKKTTETSSSEESSYDGYDDYDYNQEENYGY